MSNNSKKEYYLAGRGASELSVLPKFMNTDTNSILFTIHNPQSIILDDIYRDINTSFLNLNPMSLSLSLPSKVYYADDLVAGAVPIGDVDFEQVSLYNFHNNLPTRIGATGVTGDSVSGGGTGYTYKDFHYISPLFYHDGDARTRNNEGYVGLREGSWLTPDLITVFDSNLEMIQEYSMSFLQQNLQAPEDEWIDLDDNKVHILKHPYIVDGSVNIINPSPNIPADITSGWTMINGNQIQFDSTPDSNLVVEYNYVPSPLLNSIFYFNKQHNTETSSTSNDALPSGFSYLPTEMHATNSIVNGATYDHSTSVERNVKFKKLIDDEYNIRLETKANELATGQTATINLDYYGTYSYNLLNDTGSYHSGSTHTIVLNDNLTAPYEIYGNKISVTDNNSVDITGLFTHSSTGDVDYLTIASATAYNNGADIHIPYKKTLTFDKVAETFSEEIIDTFKVGSTSASIQYYLSVPYASGATSTQFSYITLPASFGRGFTFDAVSAGLSTGATFSIEYQGMNKTSKKHNKEWFSNMLGVDFTEITTAPTGTNTGPSFEATDVYNGYEIINLTTDTSIHDSLYQGSDNIHLVDNHFVNPIYSLNTVEGRVEIYNNQNEIQDFYNLFWTERSIDYISGSYSIYSSVADQNTSPVAIRYFQESLAILFNTGGTAFNLKFYDLNTFALLEDAGNFNVPGASGVNSFSFDKENNVVLFTSTTSYKVSLYFDYYTRIANEDGTEDLYFRENDYTNFSINTTAGASTSVGSTADLISFPVEHSIDHWGRVLGSDRWPNETLKEYLTRLTNITGASGNTSYQKALNGLSATLNTGTYRVNSLDHFYLNAPVALHTEQFSMIGSTGEFSLIYPADSITGISVYISGAIIEGATASLNAGSTGVIIDGGTSGASGATATVHYKTESVLTVDGATSSNYILSYENITYTTPGLLKVGATGPTGEYKAVLTYYGRSATKVYDPELDSEVYIHKLDETFTGQRGVTASASQIKIYDLLNSAYIEDNSTNNIPGSTASSIINGGSTLKFKWGEFEWDKYSWSDGESIQLGLKTIFDATTASATASSYNFTSGTAVGNHLKFLGLDDNNVGNIQCGAFYYKDATLYLGSNINSYLFPSSTGYQDLNYLSEDGATTSVVLSYTETPIVVKGETGTSLYIAEGDQTMNVIGSQHENLGSATALGWISNGLTLGVTYAPSVDDTFDVFVRSGASGEYTWKLDDVTYDALVLTFTASDKIWLNTLTGSLHEVIYVYNSYRGTASDATEWALGTPGPYGGAVKQDDRFIHSIDSSQVSTVFPEVDIILDGIAEQTDQCFSINEVNNTIKITDQGAGTGDAHLMFKDSGEGATFGLHDLSFNNTYDNIGNKLLVFGLSTSVVSSHSIEVSSTVIDNECFDIQFAVEILDAEHAGIKGSSIEIGSTGSTGIFFSNTSSITGEGGLALISTELRGPTGDISIQVKENNNLLETIIINNLGAV